MIYSNDMSDLVKVSEKAAEFWAAHDMFTLPEGRYDLGDGDFVNVMSYETRSREGAQYEAHRQYIDIQIVISGREVVEVAPLSALRSTVPYNVDDDAEFFDGTTAGQPFHITPGDFIALYPNDAHMPQERFADKAEHTKKAVFKIRL